LAVRGAASDDRRMTNENPADELKCGGCGENRNFEMIERDIPVTPGVMTRIGFVRCTFCKTAIGVIDVALRSHLEHFHEQWRVMTTR
jgi:hypothetical protein